MGGIKKIFSLWGITLLLTFLVSTWLLSIYQILQHTGDTSKLSANRFSTTEHFVSTGNSGNLREQEKVLIEGKKIAVAVTVTKDGPYLDGAAVLLQSIKDMNSKFLLDMVALVHPGIVKTRESLVNLGFKIIEFDPPIKSQDIEGKHLRETIDKSGCCGALELLKLRAYELDDYYRVLLLDMDSIIIKNIDHLFEADEGWGLQFTWDLAMDNKGSRAPPIQGGFLLLRPSRTTYDQLIGIVRKGDFRPGTGWGGEKIGWCWGGQTVQGLLAYYYTIIAKAEARPLDDCVYNAMDTLPEHCAHVEHSEVYSAHFTVCQKPWECHRGRKGLCEFLHTFWWKVRQGIEQEQGLTVTPQCCRGCTSKTYQKLPLPFERPLWRNSDPKK